MKPKTLVAWVAALALAMGSAAYAQARPGGAAGAAAAAAAAASQPRTAKAAKPAVNPFKGLAKTYDKMLGITWYRHASSPRHAESNAFYLYFGRQDDGRVLPLRLKVRYFADDWLFVRRAWAKADGVRVEVPQDAGRVTGWERDHADGDIWEWSDTVPSSLEERAAVRQLANAKSVTVRFEGQRYYADRNLSALQLRAMRELISAYEEATGQAWK